MYIILFIMVIFGDTPAIIANLTPEHRTSKE